MKANLRPTKPVIVIDLFPELLERLLILLRGLDSNRWQLPTACPGWSVKDVSLHLLGVEIGNLSVRRDGHSIGSRIDEWKSLVHYINQWNQEWVSVSRRISNNLLIDLLEVTGRQMAGYFQSLDPFAMGGPVSWVGDAPAPIWLDIAREYTERWHHQQHIREAVGEFGLKEPKFLAPVLETFARALPRAFRNAKASTGSTVSVEITGKSGSSWSIVREGDTWQLFEGLVEGPDAYIRLDEDYAWKLFTGGLSTFKAGSVIDISGDERLASHIYQAIAIIA